MTCAAATRRKREVASNTEGGTAGAVEREVEVETAAGTGWVVVALEEQTRHSDPVEGVVVEVVVVARSRREVEAGGAHSRKDRCNCARRLHTMAGRQGVSGARMLAM